MNLSPVVGVVAVVVACSAAARAPATEERPASRAPVEEVAPLVAAAPAAEADGEVVARLERVEARVVELERALAEQAARQPTPTPPPRPRGPDPAAVYAVPIDGNPFVGPRHAPVTMVMGFAFSCPFCNRVRPTLDDLRSHYGDDLKIVYKHFLIHPQVATIPALAACAAHRQDRFLEMYERIYSDGFEAGRQLGRDRMLEIAGALGLRMRRFEADLDGAACAERVRRDQAELTQVGQRGTPAFYINGRFLSGAQPFDRFKALIDEELARARASGIPAQGYYDHILASGLARHDDGN